MKGSCVFTSKLDELWPKKCLSLHAPSHLVLMQRLCYLARCRRDICKGCHFAECMMLLVKYKLKQLRLSLCRSVQCIKQLGKRLLHGGLRTSWISDGLRKKASRILWLDPRLPARSFTRRRHWVWVRITPDIQATWRISRQVDIYIQCSPITPGIGDCHWTV